MLRANQSIVIHAARDLRLESRDIVKPGPGEVLINVQAGGICGSDLHYYQHGGFGPIQLREPMILGHEVSGLVAALGAGIDNLEIGQLVAISPSRPCHSCSYCLQDQKNHCLNMQFYGSAMPFPHIQGAFQQQLIAGATQCVRAEGLTASQAAMAEPLAVCLHAIAQAGDLRGKTVLITGCGPHWMPQRAGRPPCGRGADRCNRSIRLYTENGAHLRCGSGAQHIDRTQRFTTLSGRKGADRHSFGMLRRSVGFGGGGCMPAPQWNLGSAWPRRRYERADAGHHRQGNHLARLVSLSR